MIGSDRQPLEAAVSRLRPEDPDPLLAFSIESGAPAPLPPPQEPAAQPVAPQADPQPPSLPATPTGSLAARIEGLARALDDSKAQVTSLKSEVATLVRAVEDIRKQSSRAVIPTPPAVKSRARTTWTASAIVAAMIGAGAAFAGWTYLPSDADSSIVASAAPQQSVSPQEAQPVQTPAADPSPPNATPITSESSAPRVVLTKASVLHAPQPPKAAQAPQAPQSTRYVGTLSIDAVPGGDVFVDRETAGPTPLRLTNLRAGSHLIWIQREGYRRFTRVVQVPADRVTRLSATLEPIAAR